MVTGAVIPISREGNLVLEKNAGDKNVLEKRVPEMGISEKRTVEKTIPETRIPERRMRHVHHGFQSGRGH